MPSGFRDRPISPTIPSLLVVVVIVVGLVALSPSESFRSVRHLIGLGEGRLGTAPDVPHGKGHFAFIATQHGRPVGYDPCRVIEVRVNPQQAPAYYDDLVDTAIEHTSAATGLKLERVGLTDDRDLPTAGGIGTRRRPVLVMWAKPSEVHELTGDVAGIGGSVRTQDDTGRQRFVTGRVVLDAGTFAGFSRSERPLAQAIVDHEFGHLVGLDHVDDPGELMYRDNVGRTTYGPGDREGLARLGSIPC